MNTPPMPRRLALLTLALGVQGLSTACRPDASAPQPASTESSAMQFAEFSATLFFDESPGFSTRQLMDAFALEGYDCEPFTDPHWQHSLLCGQTAVFLGTPQAARHDEHPDTYPAVTQTGIDYDTTWLINPLAAWQDFQAARHEVRFLYKIVQTEGSHMAHWQCDLFTALLGIHQVQPLRALWLDHLNLFIGQTDLAEYLAYRNTQDGTPASQPDPLMFGTLALRKADGLWQSWTTGLDQFGHPNLHVSAPGLSAVESLGPLFNTGRMVLANSHKGWRLQPGESLSAGSFTARVAKAHFRDEDMLQLIPI